MLPTTQKWEKIIEELKMSHNQKKSHNGKMCKEKRNNFMMISNHFKQKKQ